MELTNVLLSIRPKFVEAIMNESKKYEFRKSLFRNDSVKDVLVYSTFPIQMIVGTFRVGKVFHDDPENLWRMLHEYAGIDERAFFEYYCGRNEGYAIEVKSPREFKDPIDPWILDPDFVPPQSFKYVDWVLFQEESLHPETMR